MTSNPAASAPVPGVSALIWQAGRVLLVRRARAPLAGLWALPGGRVEAGETAEEALVREVREETAIAVDVVAPIDTVSIDASDDSDGPPRRFAVTVFRARYRSGTLRAGDDAAEARWVSPDDLPDLPVAEQTLAIVARHACEPADA